VSGDRSRFRIPPNLTKEELKEFLEEKNYEEEMDDLRLKSKRTKKSKQEKEDYE
jgi:hypothetical protein